MFPGFPIFNVSSLRKVWRKENSKRGRMVFFSFFSEFFHTWRLYILLFYRIIFNYQTQKCVMRARRWVFFFYHDECNTLNPELPRQILNFLSFVARKAGNMGWRKQVLFSFRCDIFFEIPVFRIATKVRSCYSRRSSWNRRIQGSQTLRGNRDTLKNENNLYVDFAMKEIKNATSRIVSHAEVFILSILICYDWMRNHFNKVLICPVLLPQINWI